MIKVQRFYATNQLEKYPEEVQIAINVYKILTEIEKVKAVAHNLSFYAFEEGSEEAQKFNDLFDEMEALTTRIIKEGVELD